MSAWQWASTVLVFHQPRRAGSRTRPDPALWKARPDGLKGKTDWHAHRDQTPFLESLSYADGTREQSVRWFRGTGLEAAVGALSTTPYTASAPRPDLEADDAVSPLAEAGIRIAALTITAPIRQREYVALHLVQSGPALAEPTWLTCALHRPTKAGTLPGHSLTGEQLRDGVLAALGTAGLDVFLGPGGSMVRGPGPQGQLYSSVYTISVAVPSAQLPDLQCAEPEASLTLSERWAHALATARTNTPTPTLSDLSPAGAARAAVSLGPVTGWASHAGFGLVANPHPAGEPGTWNAEVAHATRLAHSVFVDLACLVQRQDHFLRNRAKELSDLAVDAEAALDAQADDAVSRPTETGSTDADGTSADQPVPSARTTAAARYRRSQADLLAFLGSTWFEEVPRREDATRVLRAMQNARFLADRLDHTSREEEAFLRFLESQDRERHEREQERQAERREQERAERAERHALEAEQRERERAEREARHQEEMAQRERERREREAFVDAQERRRDREEDEREAERNQRDRVLLFLQIVAAVMLPATVIYTISGGLGRDLTDVERLWTGVASAVLTLGLIAAVVALRPRRRTPSQRDPEQSENDPPQ